VDGRPVEGPAAGGPEQRDTTTAPIDFRGARVGELTVATSNEAFVRRVATIVSPYCAG
jgi:hypothetical protein